VLELELAVLDEDALVVDELDELAALLDEDALVVDELDELAAPLEEDALVVDELDEPAALLDEDAFVVEELDEPAAPAPVALLLIPPVPVVPGPLQAAHRRGREVRTMETARSNMIVDSVARVVGERRRPPLRERHGDRSGSRTLGVVFASSEDRPRALVRQDRRRPVRLSCTSGRLGQCRFSGARASHRGGEGGAGEVALDPAPSRAW
jgi:hypothetical protein